MSAAHRQAAFWARFPTWADTTWAVRKRAQIAPAAGFVGGASRHAVLVGPPLGKGLGPSRLMLSAISIKVEGESSVTLTQFASHP